MTATPYMQLYVGDYLSDTLHLTTEQHGAYLLLLMTMWRAGAELPNDPSKLARIARVTPKRWPSLWAEIEPFFTVDGDVIRNDRLTKEHQKAVSISQERKTAGRNGGKAKALKNNDVPLASATNLPPHLLKHSQKSESDKSSVDKSTGVSTPPDPVKIMFDSGVRFLGQAGIPDGKARGILGKWRGAHGAEAVIAALGKAQREGAIDPVAFIEGCFRQAKRKVEDYDFWTGPKLN